MLSTGSSEKLAKRLGILSLCLLSAYPLIVMRASFPVRLLDPSWQLGLANSLIDNAVIAIVGVIFLYLSLHLDPLQERWHASVAAISRLAVPVSLAFLLLIPLRAFNLWQIIRVGGHAQQRQLQQAALTVNQLREALAASGSTAELVERMQAIKAPPLPPALRNQPFAVIQRELSASIASTEALIRARRARPSLSAENQSVLLLTNVRMMLLTLIYSVAFAAVAQRRYSRTIFLDELLSLRFKLPFRGQHPSSQMPWLGRRRG